MNVDVLVPGATAGVLSGAALLLPTLAVAILYEHGRYVPLWLPDLGIVGAFVTHALWTNGLPGPVAAIVGITVAIVLACLIHHTLLARFLLAKDYLSPLLIGLGLSQMFQAAASFYGDGMSQHYPANIWSNQYFSKALGTAIYYVDIAFVAATAVAVLALYAFLRLTHRGRQVRLVNANADYSRILALPVRAVDLIVLASAATLVTVGCIMRGIRYDLQPTMMFYPGLSAIVACIVATPGRRSTAMLVVLTMEILSGLIGTFPAYAPFTRAVPFAVLLLVMALRAVARPRTIQARAMPTS